MCFQGQKKTRPKDAPQAALQPWPLSPVHHLLEEGRRVPDGTPVPHQAGFFVQGRQVLLDCRGKRKYALMTFFSDRSNEDRDWTILIGKID